MEQYELSIDCYTKEMMFSQENSKSINNRAYCFAKLKKYKEAV